MTVEEVLMEKVKVLPPNRKQKVLDFVEFLAGKESKLTPLLTATNELPPLLRKFSC